MYIHTCNYIHPIICELLGLKWSVRRRLLGEDSAITNCLSWRQANQQWLFELKKGQKIEMVGRVNSGFSSQLHTRSANQFAYVL